jgi:hypothetical protein
MENPLIQRELYSVLLGWTQSLRQRSAELEMHHRSNCFQDDLLSINPFPASFSKPAGAKNAR